MKVELRVKKLDTGETMVAAFESLHDVETWLMERPKFIEVLGVAVPQDLDEEIEAKLRRLMRPLDDEEKARRDQEYEERLAAIEAQTAEENRQARAASRTGEIPKPGDLMVVGWHEGQGFQNLVDDRAVPVIVQEALKAWVAERNEWLHPKRMHVGAAQISIWPEAVPDGKERIEPGGEFSAVPGFAD